MFDGGDRGRGGIAQHGAELGLRNVRPFGLDQTLAPAGKPGAQEDNAGIGVGGMKNQIDGSIGMDAETGNRHPIANRRLATRFHQPQFP